MHRNSLALLDKIHVGRIIPYAKKIHGDAGKRALMNLRGRLPPPPPNLACTYPIVNPKLTETRVRIFILNFISNYTGA